MEALLKLDKHLTCSYDSKTRMVVIQNKDERITLTWHELRDVYEKMKGIQVGY
jgi:hypothetical protein